MTYFALLFDEDYMVTHFSYAATLTPHGVSLSTVAQAFGLQQAQVQRLGDDSRGISAAEY
jgi:plasmid maintenance system antidote protein VapI